jgi:hypothetical protein
MRPLPKAQQFRPGLHMGFASSTVCGCGREFRLSGCRDDWTCFNPSSNKTVGERSACHPQGGEMPRTPRRMQSIAGAREQDNRQLRSTSYILRTWPGLELEIAEHTMQDIEMTNTRLKEGDGDGYEARSTNRKHCSIAALQRGGDWPANWRTSSTAMRRRSICHQH